MSNTHWDKIFDKLKRAKDANAFKSELDTALRAGYPIDYEHYISLTPVHIIM